MTLHAFACPTCGATVHVIDAAARITCPHRDGDGRRVAVMVRVEPTPTPTPTDTDDQ